jgi:2-keto-4-pentenoate hydratase/2-oxohepta-3-ene-1,7-dioic acid hydratase in catechol pathway
VRIANLSGRAVLLTDEGATDIAEATDGRFGPDLAVLLDDWPAFVAAAPDLQLSPQPYSNDDLGSPSPRPAQVFAIGLNYRSHAEEAGLDVPSMPAVFTKFPASLGAPFADIELSGEMVDWEVEIVVVMGARADRVSVEEAWGHVAGLCVGQDVSDRMVQFAAGGQFSLGKSYRTYGPVGPWMTTLDELADPDDLALGCSINGEVVQEDRSTSLIFDVSDLISQISAVVPLLPGDLIFTGTPAGVGIVRQPPRFLAPGDVLESWVEGLGTIVNHCIEGGSR